MCACSEASQKCLPFRAETSVSPNWVHPTPGPTSPEESPSFSLRGEAQGQQTPQLEEDQRAWQRLEQLLLGQVRGLGRGGHWGGWKEVCHSDPLPPCQLEELKQQLDLQDGMGQLHLGVVSCLAVHMQGRGEGPRLSRESKGLPLLQGATDSEKRVQHLTLENEALKQSLILTQDLLRHWGPGPHTRAPQVFSLAAAVLCSLTFLHT